MLDQRLPCCLPPSCIANCISLQLLCAVAVTQAMYALSQQLSAGMARMAIIFCLDVSAHLLLLWSAGSRQELDIRGVHSNPNLHDCSRGAGSIPAMQWGWIQRGARRRSKEERSTAASKCCSHTARCKCCCRAACKSSCEKQMQGGKVSVHWTPKLCIGIQHSEVTELHEGAARLGTQGEQQ